MLEGWVLEENERFLTEEQCGVFRAVHDVMHWFAGKHVRNVAVGGLEDLIVDTLLSGRLFFEISVNCWKSGYSITDL